MSVGSRLGSCNLYFSTYVSWLHSYVACALGSLYSWCCNKQGGKICCGFLHTLFHWLQTDETGRGSSPLLFVSAGFIVFLAGASSTSCPCTRSPEHMPHWYLKNIHPQRHSYCWDFLVTWLETAVDPLINSLCLTSSRFMVLRWWNQNAIKHNQSVQLKFPDIAREILFKHY